ncbi:hypothetical protein KKF61_02625 [Patescibacteria group bacterium]|nr:hypothetical protein [Patescibacteria group bacterium]MBU0963817.1 hypothetical protein [Patescibacteria group bacterium]
MSTQSENTWLVAENKRLIAEVSRLENLLAAAKDQEITMATLHREDQLDAAGFEQITHMRDGYPGR